MQLMNGLWQSRRPLGDAWITTKLIADNSCVVRCICLDPNVPIIPIAWPRKRHGNGGMAGQDGKIFGTQF
jgi:hypothetical protein